MDAGSTRDRMQSVDLTDDIKEGTQLLINSPKKTSFIDFNSQRVRLSVLAVLYYIWLIPTISIDANALNGTSSGGGGGSNTLTDDDKTVKKLLIAGNVFLLLGTILLGTELKFNLWQFSNITKYLRYICVGLFLLGSILHVSASTKRWDINCIDDVDSGWCKSSYYSVDFFAELFSLLMCLDIFLGDKDTNYLNMRRVRIMCYSFLIFLSTFIFALDYQHYVTDITSLDRDNMAGYWIVTIICGFIYCTMVIRLICCTNKDVKDNIPNDIDKGIVVGCDTEYISNIITGLLLLTGTALCWIKPSFVITVDSDQALYRKQFLMFIGVACMIAYDLQFVKFINF